MPERGKDKGKDSRQRFHLSWSAFTLLVLLRAKLHFRLFALCSFVISNVLIFSFQLINIKVENKKDIDVPVLGHNFQTEQEAVRFCQLSEQNCTAIHKPNELSSSYIALEPNFLLSSDDESSVLFVKKEFVNDLGKLLTFFLSSSDKALLFVRKKKTTVHQRPVSQKSRNFSDLFRMPQFSLYLRNAEVLSHQSS